MRFILASLLSCGLFAGCAPEPVASIHPLLALRPLHDHGSPYGLTPQQIATAYRFPAAPPADAPPQTIALIESGNAVSLANDLAVYDAQFNLPACTSDNGCLSVVNERGGAALPPEDDSWQIETDMDAEVAHGLCPTCRLLVVEADAPSSHDLATAVRTAIRLGATEISNSYGGPEWGPTHWDSASYIARGVAVIASSGDSGYGVSWPASLARGIAAGGTTLHLNPDGSRASETAWNLGGSGCAVFALARPWQTQLPGWHRTMCGTARAVADVSADSDPVTGASIYDGTPFDGDPAGWWSGGGTSLASPIIAAAYALAGGVSPHTQAVAVLYRNRHLLYDVTSGSTGECWGASACTAGQGYDGPTGNGSPAGVSAFTSRHF